MSLCEAEKTFVLHGVAVTLFSKCRNVFIISSL